MALAKAGFALDIRPVSSLRPHEETIRAHVKKLASEILRDGVQKDPVIVDNESATVLDGMHRLAAFQEIRLENAVCCSVDYGSRAVSLGRWARVYTVGEAGSFEKHVRDFGNLRRTTLAEAFVSLERRNAGIGVFTGAAVFVSEGKQSIEDAAREMASFDRLSEMMGWERSFVAEDDIGLPLQDVRNVVVLLRRLSKDDVVWAAKSGRLFPCKTSMHIVDPRPVAVNFPLERLDGGTTATLRDTLRGKEGRMLPAGSVYEGRRYKERLLRLDEV
jgi:hypothetical protein